ncbi:MAG: hypothetical protein LAT79_13635 [Kiritimatiellae bacterium]|nr:hypothetical protein [Kiritimatiellia bacterium]
MKEAVLEDAVLEGAVLEEAVLPEGALAGATFAFERFEAALTFLDTPVPRFSAAAFCASPFDGAFLTAVREGGFAEDEEGEGLVVFAAMMLDLRQTLE